MARKVQALVAKATADLPISTRRIELFGPCVKGLFVRRGPAAQLVSKLNQPKVQAIFACTHKLKAGETIGFTQERVLN